ncbi:MAG: ribbon-helix-helix protein, CopG family [Metallibacterium scheffleri]
MSERFVIALSDDLNAEIDAAAKASDTSKSEILRKAIQLYIIARDGCGRGLKLGLVSPDTRMLETEIVGL